MDARPCVASAVPQAARSVHSHGVKVADILRLRCGLCTLLFSVPSLTGVVLTKSFKLDLPHLFIPFLWIELGAIELRPRYPLRRKRAHWYSQSVVVRPNRTGLIWSCGSVSVKFVTPIPFYGSEMSQQRSHIVPLPSIKICIPPDHFSDTATLDVPIE